MKNFKDISSPELFKWENFARQVTKNPVVEIKVL